MIQVLIHCHLLTSCRKIFHSEFVRTLRISFRNNPRKIEGKVKTLTQYDNDNINFNSFNDLVQDAKNLSLGDEVEMEKFFSEDGEFGNAIEKCERLYALGLSQEKGFKCHTKKKLIGKKYFKLDEETNLLTYAAKEQIKYLHESDPTRWNPKVLSECFPISESGVKKLLKCNFKLASPDKIKKHDKKVAQRWNILKSGKPSSEICYVTRKLYTEGKLIDDYFGGNPNLPTTPPSKKEFYLNDKKIKGEFSAIIQTYLEYESKKLLTDSTQDKNESRLQLSLNKEPTALEKLNLKKGKLISEFDDETLDIYKTDKKSKNKENGDIPLKQFKEILKEESMFISEGKYENNEVVEENVLKTELLMSNSFEPDELKKIPKYCKNSDSTIYTNMYEINEDYQTYNNKVRKIIMTKKFSENKKLFKIGKCVYDSNGEFLYKLS